MNMNCMKHNTNITVVSGLTDSVNNARPKERESWGCLEMGGNFRLQS